MDNGGRETRVRVAEKRERRKDDAEKLLYMFFVFLGRGHYFALLWEGHDEMDGEIMVDCARSYATRLLTHIR